MKIIAKQVPPEWQESPLNRFDEFPEDVFVFGNRHYLDHTTDFFNNIPRTLEDIADELEYLREGKNHFGDFSVILEAYTGKHDYTRNERLKWIELIEKWESSDEEGTIFADVLALLLGKPFNFGTIRGCSQGDWQYIIYPAEYGREWLESFEAEYFNTGAEWDVYEEGDEDDHYSVYCTSYDPRREIASIANTTPDKVILYAFDGWDLSPRYKEVRE